MENIYPTFDDFWQLYDKKVGKPNAIKEWCKLTQLEKETAMLHAENYINSREKKYCKDPERYLKHRTFEDEIIQHTNGQSTKQTTGQYLAEKYFRSEGNEQTGFHNDAGNNNSNNRT
jgi:hypothetical protein